MITIDNDMYVPFLKNYMSLLYYVAIYEKLIAPVPFNDFINLLPDSNLLVTCSRCLDENPKLISDFLELNRHLLTPDEIDIISGFKKRVSGLFAVIKYEEEHAIFVDRKNGKLYAVKALSDPFSDLIPDVPAVIETTIMAFKGMIVYDGFVVAKPLPVTMDTPYVKNAFEQLKKGKLISKM